MNIFNTEYTGKTEFHREKGDSDSVQLYFLRGLCVEKNNKRKL
jgi:hypothetical protein